MKNKKEEKEFILEIFRFLYIHNKTYEDEMPTYSLKSKIHKIANNIYHITYRMTLRHIKELLEEGKIESQRKRGRIFYRYKDGKDKNESNFN